jgi:UDP-glucose 4-epimerase
MKPVLIWGARGFLGRNLVRGFLAEGRPVTALTRRRNSGNPFAEHPLLRVVHLPERPADWDILPRVIAESELIYGLAGVSGAVASNCDPVASLEGNCLIHAAFLSACAKAGNKPHVVFPSSRLVYGTPDTLPVSESAQPRPASVYAAHKLCVEHYYQIAAARGEISYTICRISNPYGLQDGQSGRGYGFISQLIEKGLKGQPLTIFGDGGQTRDYLHIDDLVQALWLCGSRIAGLNEILNIGSGEGITIREAAAAVQKLRDVPIVHVPWPEEDWRVESGDYVADIGKARAAIGFEPRFQFQQGFEDLAYKYRQDELDRFGGVELVRQQLQL